MNHERSAMTGDTSNPFRDSSDAVFSQQVERLHRLIVWSRWLVVGVLWLTIGLYSLWKVRSEIALLREHFTWVAVRYGLYHNPVATFGLSLCIGMTTAVLIWQSRNILWGRPHHYQQQLEKTVFRVRQQGVTHPLWKWIIQ